MAESTNHYGLKKIHSGDKFSDNDYQYTYRDRSNIDHKLFMGAEAHKHDGAGPAVADPSAPLGYTLQTSGGSLPASKTYRYKFTYIDEFGAETAPSPEQVVTTPAAVADPGAPSLSTQITGGSLSAGSYFYMVTAYKTSNTSETRPSGRVFATLPSGTINGRISVVLPMLPAGATGFNIYRRAPGNTNYFYLTSVAMNVPTPPGSYLDDGTASPNCNRVPPTANTTANTSSVVLTIPGATPVVPAGAVGWKVYRTDTAGQWSASLLAVITEETSEGSGIIVTTYTDTGTSTTRGIYPAVSEVIGSPEKVVLTNAAEVSGTLPPGLVYHPHELVVRWNGAVQATTEDHQWVFPFTRGRLDRVIVSLGKDFAPASTPVRVDIKKYLYNSGTPSWGGSIFALGYVELPVGEETVTYIIDPNLDDSELLENDRYIIEVTQSGGGATPTDFDLTVQAVMWVRSGSQTTSLTW